MSYANMDGVPTQTEGVSEILASDWNAYVRDNFDSIKFGHLLATESPDTRPAGVAEGTMVYTTDTERLWVYSSGDWHVVANPVVGTGVSVVGRSANSSGDRADIVASADGQVLRRASGVVGFGSVATAGIGDLQVTTAKIADGNVTTAKIADGDVTAAKLDSNAAARLAQGHVTVADNAAKTALGNVAEGYMVYQLDNNKLYVNSNGVTANWVEIIDLDNAGGLSDAAFTGYRLNSIIEYTSNSTFSKGSYPWLRAIRVRCVGGGGGGGGAQQGINPGAAAACGGGGGGAYAESLITDIAGLASSVTVTVGSGGAGGSGVTIPGSASNGGNSSFGSLVIAAGGLGAANAGSSGESLGAAGGARSSCTGTIRISGNAGTKGDNWAANGTYSAGGVGGGSAMGGGGGVPGATANGASNGSAGREGGGGGGSATKNQVANATGGAGGSGLVIVELYA